MVSEVHTSSFLTALQVYQGGELSLTWTDDDAPLTSGSYIGLRTINTRARFDDIQANRVSLSYLHTDHLGSNSLMTDASGTVVPNSQAAYLPFGDWRNEPATSDLTDLGYTEHRHNNIGGNDLGLIYMNARYYVPGIGRFASADSLIPNLVQPQSHNRYSYVSNNPINSIDPTGHCDVNSGDYYEDYDCVAEAQALANEYGVSFYTLAEFWELGASTPEELAAIWQAFMSSIPQLANPNPNFGDTLAQPETIAELMAMMKIAPEVANNSQDLYDMNPDKADCHNVCAVSTEQSFEEFDETAKLLAKLYFELGEIYGEATLNQNTSVVWAFFRDAEDIASASSVTYSGKHAALMVFFDESAPSNSIVVQVNGSVEQSGVYFTRIKDTTFFQALHLNYIGIPRY